VILDDTLRLDDLLRLVDEFEQKYPPSQQALNELITHGHSQNASLHLIEGYGDDIHILDKQKLIPGLSLPRFAVYASPQAWQKILDAVKDGDTP
jgi:hypothetical protein